MHIEVKTLTGRKQQFDVEPTTTVRELKAELQEKEGIESKQIRLVHAGQKMNNDDTLETYGLKAGMVINMVLALRGGQ